MSITLSKMPLDMGSTGYQPPLPVDIVQQMSPEFEEDPLVEELEAKGERRNERWLSSQALLNFC
jgi:hypothetical protein